MNWKRIVYITSIYFVPLLLAAAVYAYLFSREAVDKYLEVDKWDRCMCDSHYRDVEKYEEDGFKYIKFTTGAYCPTYEETHRNVTVHWPIIKSHIEDNDLDKYLREFEKTYCHVNSEDYKAYTKNVPILFGWVLLLTLSIFTFAIYIIGFLCLCHKLYTFLINRKIATPNALPN